MNRKENFTAGFIRENPVFSLYLGICSTLAITTTLNNAIGMGVAVNITPNEIRIPVYIVVIATLVKIIQMLIKAYAASLDTALGVFIPLIVVNCIILGRAESFASKNNVFDSALDGLGMGLGYTCSLIVMSVIRQVISTGVLNFTNPFDATQMIFEFRIIPEDYVISVFNQPFGAFVTFALLAAALAGYKNAKTAKAEKKKKAQEAAQAALAKEAK